MSSDKGKNMTHKLRQFKYYLSAYIKPIFKGKIFLHNMHNILFYLSKRLLLHHGLKFETVFHRLFILWWSGNEETQCRERAKVWNQPDQRRITYWQCN